jgi:7-cyano-7-deazaguanine synthase in queuosine biosynthesis
MTWHVLTRVGPDDAYDAQLESSEPRIHVAFERTGDRWLLPNNVLQHISERSGSVPPAEATDLVYLAMSAYSADLRIPRRFGAERWQREIVLHLPVQDLALWSEHAAHVERTLSFLTGDMWELRLRSRHATQPSTRQSKLDKVQYVCLFSGGLDSLVGALDLLSQGKFVALVGHHGAGITNSVQDRVLAAVKAKYGPTAAPFMFHAQPPKGNVTDGEPTMRSRSFLFLSLGVAVASSLGGSAPLVVAENGLISLNVPLTAARSGSRSTRTTHPHFIALFRELLVRLGLPHGVEMPYRFRTKGEMLSECKDQGTLAVSSPLTMSCSHPEAGRFHGYSPNHHCGYCVPCIIRKAAMKSAGLADAPYSVQVEMSPPLYTEEAGRDYRAFQMALDRVRGMSRTRAAFRVLGPGPFPSEEVLDFAGVYLRGMEEVRGLIERRESR